MQLQEHLNPQQLKAAEHVEGPMLVIAGAGSGKTRIVTYRIAHLLELGVPSEAILAVTFTNKAAGEMRSRIEKLSHKKILASTFHSLGARILRESITALGYDHNFTIFDEEDSLKVLKECFQEKGIKDDKAMKKTQRIEISSAKNAMSEPEDLLSKEIYHLYCSKLKNYNAVDFDDLLFLTARLFQEHPFILEKYQKRWTFILIDEYQDTNQAQYTLLKLLSAKHQNVFAVGDPDQSIYSWRGANIGNILNFEKDYPGAIIVPLEQNYRSTTTILSAANALIDQNENRYEKKLWSNRGEGDKIGFCLSESDRDEVTFVLERIYHHHYKQNIPLSDSVIFYRTHFQSRVFEDALLRENIPYIIVGGVSFYMRREIKDILAYLRIASTGHDYLAFSRTINLPKRGIGLATIGKLRLATNGDLIHGAKEILNGRIPFQLSARQRSGLADYIKTIDAIRASIHHGVPIHETIEELIKRCYEEVLKEDPETAQERGENLDELISLAAEWEEENPSASLVAFLEELTLKGSHDETHEADALRLMTLHNGKGLEFSVAMLVGMEEEIFPHINSLGNFEALEEERRLCYVGMTRAKDHLYLSAARTRYLFGSLRSMRPSRFLSEIPEIYLKKYHKESYSPYEFEQEAGDLNPGDTVYHKDFGKGTIQKAYNTSLGLTFDVLFETSGQNRSLVAKYAKLSKL